MKIVSKAAAARVVLFCIAMFESAVAGAAAISGLWDGTIQFDEAAIPFTMELQTDGAEVRGAFFNGEDRVGSTSGSLRGDQLSLNFDHYATQLTATIHDGVISGRYGNERYGLHAVQLRPHRVAAAARGPGPDIKGLWILPVESTKGEHAFRLIVRQHGDETSAAILRVDGDTGLLTGTFRDGRFLLNHFDGARALTLEIRPRGDGRLDVTQRGFHSAAQSFVAIRPDAASRQGLAPPADFATHTGMRNPNEPFAFSFPDLQGRLVANTDEKFKNKVVVINITGSWCPNCHDEAPFLVDLYRRYHGLGLEIVAIDFEEAEQLPALNRLHAFLKRYGIEYTYLVAGTPDQLHEKITQAENLNSWPTTFFVGRDGLVHAVHAGFAAAATGEFHAQLQTDVTTTVERLLAQ